MKYLYLLLLSLCSSIAIAKNFNINKGDSVYIFVEETSEPVTQTACDLLKQDLQHTLRSELIKTTNKIEANIILCRDNTLGREEFILEVTDNGKIEITGNDGHGIAYGIIELSRLLGVSPWEWWADAKPKSLSKFTLKDGYRTAHKPSVEYRGIFINDEDWGLMPWSNNYEKLGHGIIGPKTNARIFELMLRLRANYYWPAMHECTQPFFLTKGNREMAAKYGIYIGGSHCEPMASSTAVEWAIRGNGQYDYVNNSGNVKDFWEKRVKEVANQEIVYTLGMRGVHDGKMQGAKTIEEQKDVLRRVITDQRNMLVEHVNNDIESIPQVFIPYKEVLDIYNAGLNVPEDVTLMWCDDNYGFIRHFPTQSERQRKGGNGIYYHVSYWGRPHDYLWLCTFSPNILFDQMKLAYDKGIQKMWILNVGDIKPAEYHIELFLDMAWDINSVTEQGVDMHMKNFYKREFGKSYYSEIHEAMIEHYRLAQIRRPEFMAGTRTEEKNREYWNTQRELPWSRGFKDERINDYIKLSDLVENIGRNISHDRLDTYFQLVKYPIQASAQMNLKYLLQEQDKREAAYDSIRVLTQIYNTGITNNKKWFGIMDMNPRRLSVFSPVSKPLDQPSENTGITEFSNAEKRFSKLKLKQKNEIIHSTFSATCDSATIEFRMLPNHPINGDKLSFQITLDGQTHDVIEYQTYGRSEEWKQNILRGYALKRITMPINNRKRKHHIEITPLTEGVKIIEVYHINALPSSKTVDGSAK